jgi:hypothetical protein
VHHQISDLQVQDLHIGGHLEQGQRGGEEVGHEGKQDRGPHGACNQGEGEPVPKPGRVVWSKLAENGRKVGVVRVKEGQVVGRAGDSY